MLRNSLDTTYFQTIDKRSKNDYTYTTVRPKDSPMILFSKVTGEPLVSLHFKAQKSATENTRTLITRRPQKSDVDCDFQGIINRDGQEFELVITNLTKLGKVNFNILKGEKASDGLNQINVIKPFESYSVQCDKSDNKSLILNTIKKDPENKKSEKLTVGEAESKDRPEDTPKGTYYFLSVVPEKKQYLVDLFKDTTWSCVDMFVLKERMVSAPISRSYGAGYFGGSENSSFNQRYVGQVNGNSNRYYDSRGLDISRSRVNNTMSLILSDNDDDGKEEEELGFSLFDESDITPDNNGASQPSTNNIEESYIEESSSEEVEGEEGDELSFSLFDGPPRHDPTYSSNFNPHDLFANNMINIVPKAGLFMDTREDEQSRSSSNNLMYLSKVISNSKESQVSNNTNNVINKSFAAKVSGGRRIDVSSVESISVYNYGTPGEPCVLGLSVSDNLDFKEPPSREMLLEESKLLVDEMIASESKSLIAKLKTIYKEETCTICLDDDEENPPDAVFYQCGHQCCHYDCGFKLTKCPLCRTFVTATVKV